MLNTEASRLWLALFTRPLLDFFCCCGKRKGGREGEQRERKAGRKTGEKGEAGTKP